MENDTETFVCFSSVLAYALFGQGEPMLHSQMELGQKVWLELITTGME